jgi:hypothetical protein
MAAHLMPAMHNDSSRRRHPVSLHEAAQASPTLAHLASLARESTQRLEAVQQLIPVAMRTAVRAGPVEDGVWCLLVRGSAAAAKLRQVLPALQAQLRAQGWPKESIRIKVHQ